VITGGTGPVGIAGQNFIFEVGVDHPDDGTRGVIHKFNRRTGAAARATLQAIRDGIAVGGVHHIGNFAAERKFDCHKIS
jgi:hypothetical protein